MKLSLSFSQRVCLLFLMLILGLMLASGVQYLLGSLSDKEVLVTRIAVVAQDMLAFIIPAVGLAVLVTRLPAEFLMVKKFPSAKKLGLALVGLCALFPIVELINYLCALLPWGEGVQALEAQAEATTALVAGAHTVPNLLVSILIVGVLTGLAEELFFRGALQQVLLTKPMNKHLAVWIAAVLFSLMHIQPVGFIPRAILGAYFGYVSLWSDSLWTAAICHALNNIIALVLLFG